VSDAISASAQGAGQRSATSVDLDQLRARVAGRDWYHTIELAPGVTTPGYFDHRPIASQVLPPRLDGLRCLDVATFDGFWASQMAARGAREVVAVDLLDPRKWDWPVGSPSEAIEAVSSRMGEADGFTMVAEALQHQVSRIDCSVYDLDPSEIGTFDFVFVGSLMIHVRDPVRALEAIRGVCGGALLLMDNIDPITTFTHRWRPIASFDGKGRPWWWRFNLSGLLRLVNSAGFTIVDSPERIRLKRGVGRPLPPLTWATLRDSSLRTDLHEGLFGDAHAVIRARPRQDL
jgi:tRNA (mo5U34)-methyltransferase